MDAATHRAWDRAIAKADASVLVVLRLDDLGTLFAVSSSRERGRGYIVEFDYKGMCSCACPAGDQGLAACYHRAAVFALLGLTPFTAEPNTSAGVGYPHAA